MKSRTLFFCSFALSMMLFFFSNTALMGQECGPNCPACSGGSEGALLEPGNFLFTGMAIPWGEEEKGVLRVRAGILPWLDAGIGYTVTSEKFTWSVRAQVLSEEKKGWRPALIVGTGSVRIGGNDQSLYAQVMKSFELSDDIDVRLSGGLATLIPDFDKLYALAGVSVTYGGKYSVFLSYDGKAFHPGVSWTPLEWLTLSAIMIESKDFALSAGLRWRSK